MSERYDHERRQGELIAAGEEHVWGWSGTAGTLRAERRARLLIEHAALGPGVRCLELGGDLVAIDLSEATAAIARRRVGEGAEVVVGNVETGEGLEGRMFDALVGVSVLHHVNLDAAFEHTFSHLRPGGRFAFSEPNRRRRTG